MLFLQWSRDLPSDFVPFLSEWVTSCHEVREGTTSNSQGATHRDAYSMVRVRLWWWCSETYQYTKGFIHALHLKFPSLWSPLMAWARRVCVAWPLKTVAVLSEQRGSGRRRWSPLMVQGVSLVVGSLNPCWLGADTDWAPKSFISAFPTDSLNFIFPKLFPSSAVECHK